MPKYDFTVCGTASSVRVVQTRRMPEVGVTTPILNSDFFDRPYFGGPGYNIFSALTKLGCGCYPVLTYSDKGFEAEFAALGRTYPFPTDGLSGPPDGRSSTILMIQDQERNHMTLATRYGASTPDPLLIFQEYPSHFFADSRYVIMTAPRPENVDRLLRAIEDSGTEMVLSMRIDPQAYRAGILLRALREASIVFANRDEERHIVRTCGLRSIRDLFGSGKTHTVVVTNGAGGCRILARGKTEDQTVPITRTEAGCVDAVGAGDAFLAGYMFGVLHGKDTATCGAYANTMSSFAIEKEGSTTNLPTLEQMLARNGERGDQ